MSQSGRDHLGATKALETYVNDVRAGDTDVDAALFVDRSGQALTGSAVRKVFDRLKVSTGIDDFCAHIPGTPGPPTITAPSLRRATTWTVTAHRVPPDAYNVVTGRRESIVSWSSVGLGLAILRDA